MIASAPGKIFLFGEHAVVYKRHAVVSAINLRCYAKVEKSSNFKIISELGTTGIDFKTHPYVSYAIKRFCEIKKISGARIEINSQIPIASGLGSSAAVTVAVLKALDAEFDAGLDNENIYELARLVELDVQGIASGTDPFLSTYGGSWLIPERKKVDIKDIELIVIDTEEKSITSEMVKRVAKFREKYPKVVDAIFDVIDQISLNAIELLERGDLKSISDLIRLNQLMLKSLGVSTRRIDEIIDYMDKLGIKMKITGAGGGGCIIGIGNRELIDKIKSKFKVFVLKPEKEGVRVEEEG